MSEKEADEAAHKLAALIEKATGRKTYIYKLPKRDVAKTDESQPEPEESGPKERR